MRKSLFLALILCVLFQGGLAFAQSGKGKLVVAVVDNPPFAMKNGNGEWTGFYVDLWRRVASDVGAIYEFREMAFKDVEEALKDGKADLCLAPVYETADRQRLFDFSTEIGSSEMAIAVLAARELHPFFAAIKIFLSWGLIGMGLVFLAVLALAGIIFWVIERKHNPDSFGGHPVRGIGAGIYWVGSTLVSGICTGVSLKSTSGRIFGLVWILAGAIAFSAFTASLASSLIERQQLLSFTYDLNAIRNMHLGAITGSTQASILESMGGKFTLFDTSDQGIEALLNKKIEGFFTNEGLLSHEGRQHKNKLSVHVTTLRKMRFAFALRQGSPLREKLNVSLMELMESPQWEALAGHYGLDRDLEPLSRKESRKTSWMGM